MSRRVEIDGVSYVDGGPIDLDEEPVYLADGTRLTEQVAAEITEEVLRKAGRPSMSSTNKRSPQLRLSLPAELDSQLRSRAATEKRTVSEVTREALQRYLAG